MGAMISSGGVKLEMNSDKSLMGGGRVCLNKNTINYIFLYFRCRNFPEKKTFAEIWRNLLKRLAFCVQKPLRMKQNEKCNMYN